MKLGVVTLLAASMIVVSACASSGSSSGDTQTSAVATQPGASSASPSDQESAVAESSPIYDKAAQEVWDSFDTSNQLFVCDMYTDGTDSGVQAGISAILIGFKLDLKQDLDGPEKAKAQAAAKKVLDASC
jgi:hypothetical protein